MRFQFSWNRSDTPTQQSKQKVKSTILRALELGINHIETAYGYGTSEEEIGSVIKNLPRNSFILQTKVSPRKDVNEFLKRIEEASNCCMWTTSIFLLSTELIMKNYLATLFRREGVLRPSSN
tara:strand:- start:38 stop:403 length:366 start_codon:yes stop_codon:yes gene_type:complete